VTGDALHVRWRHDGRESVFDLGWLAEHAYARDREVVPPPSSDVAAHEITGGASLEAQVDRAHAAVLERGAAIVRALPGAEAEAETERIVARLIASGLRVIETHFGRIEDLRTDNTTNANTDQLGYTDAKIDLHTDQPFLDEPPRFQVLQSIRTADAGGESALVDAAGAAAYLASEDAEAYEILRSTPVTFHRKQQMFERVVRAPIFSEDTRGVFRVRFSYFTLAPHQIPFARMESFYRAYDRFARLVRDPAHQLRFLLQPGDFVLYDNHRMLHARTAFRGARWVRGIYFDAAAR
jgi:alpha-ketoglutarate-dependent taurine dioxygenase